MNKPKLLFIVPAVFIFVLSVFISCKADVEEPEVHANEESTESQVTYYTVTYSSDGSYCKLPDELKNGFTIEANSRLTESLLPPLSSEFGEFKGWSRGSLSDQPVKEGTVVNSAFVNNGNNGLKLYAIWEPYQFNVIYNCNGGAVANDVPATYSCGKVFDLSKVTAYHVSYDFDGWYESEDFSTPKITSIRKCSRTGDLTLYAKWVGVSGAHIKTKIKQMGKSGTIFAGGDYSNTKIDEIWSGLQYLRENNWNVRIILDLTDVTGWETITEPEHSYGSDGFGAGWTLYELRLPKETKKIGREAFRGCHNLTRVILPENLEVLDKYCFYECESLQSITIPSSITYLADGCFYGCKSLQSITIPSSVTYIGKSVFEECTNLKNIIFEDDESTWYVKDYGNGSKTLGSMNDPVKNAPLLKSYSGFVLYNDKYSGD